MNKKSLSDYTVAELTTQAKTLKTLTIVVGVIIVLFGCYFIYSLVSGTWRVNNSSLGVVSLGAMGIVASTISVQLGRIGKEIKSRGEQS